MIVELDCANLLRGLCGFLPMFYLNGLCSRHACCLMFPTRVERYLVCRYIIIPVDFT